MKVYGDILSLISKSLDFLQSSSDNILFQKLAGTFGY